MISTMFQVALGGAIGSTLRWLVVMAALRLFGPGFPWGTLLVNVAGSMLMGFLAIWLVARGLSGYAPLLLTGVLGGFTTFSAFSLDAVRIWQDGTTGAAALYAGASVGLSILALIAGMALARGLMT